MSEFGKHKAVLWGKLVTTEPEVDGCDGCAMHGDETSFCAPGLQIMAGFEPCSSNAGHIYVEAKPDPAPEAERKHSHYFKSVEGLTHIDVYRVLSLFGVTDPCIGHAVKKLLCAGSRGVKDKAKDVQEAIESLMRWQEMREEDGK